MNRKAFIKTSCSLLALGAIGQLGGACSTYKVLKVESKDGLIRIPLSAFDLEDTKLVRVPKMEYDILVRKIDNQSYTALLLKCTHQDWNLIAGKSNIHCTAHGSEFDWMGNVKVGPAALGLKRFQTKIENDILILS